MAGPNEARVDALQRKCPGGACDAPWAGNMATRSTSTPSWRSASRNPSALPKPVRSAPRSNLVGVSWRATGDGQEIDPENGEDVTVCAWELVSNETGERRTVLVKIGGTAMLSGGVHFRVVHARDSNGQTEIQRILEWEEPPTQIAFYSDSQAPEIQGGEAGPVFTELASLTDWFDDRGILMLLPVAGLVWDPRRLLFPPGRRT